jgi:hypothetical protein
MGLLCYYNRLQIVIPIASPNIKLLTFKNSVSLLIRLDITNATLYTDSQNLFVIVVPVIKTLLLFNSTL